MLKLITNMFFPHFKEKLEEIPVEVLHKARPQRKKRPSKRGCLRETESIISEKVKKYLWELFGGSIIHNHRERSTSVEEECNTSTGREEKSGPKYQITRKHDKHHRRRKPKKPDIDSLNNLFNDPPEEPSLSKNVLRYLKSSSYCETVEDSTQKRKKKRPKTRRKLKKTISTMCDRAKLLLYTDFADVKQEENTTDEEDTFLEDHEEIVTIHNLNNFDAVKSSTETLKSTIFQSKCTRLYHHSSVNVSQSDKWDFEADLELWTTDYINCLVADEGRKKSKAAKTKNKTSIDKCVNDDIGNSAVIDRLLGGVRGMEQKLENGGKQRKKPQISQKVQDIQNYINNLMPPIGPPEISEPAISPQTHSIQELKKFQRELKMRIKELERKVPKHSSSAHELSFLNLTNFVDEGDPEPKVINSVRYSTKKNSFNLKIKYGDKFCDCCFLDKKTMPKDFCRRCNKKVYLVERICAGDGVYHNFCYTCYYCRKPLDSLNLCVTRGEVFCKQCFKKYFGPEVYGFIK